ncbi:MAG: hypothetical protein ABIO37_10930 [Caulobacteraceae bacterium]
MSRSLGAALALTVTLSLAASAPAAVPANSGLAQTLRSLMLPAGPNANFYGWSDLDALRGFTWAPLPPVEPGRASPDGNSFVRIGRAVIDGQPMDVVATGARTMVMSVYLRSPQGRTGEAGMTGALRQAGYTLALARCQVRRGAGAERLWFTLTLPGKRPALLYFGPLANGGEGYTLYLDGQLPLLTSREAQLYTENCGGTPATTASAAPVPAARPATGEQAVAALLAAFLQPAAAPAPMTPWAEVRKIGPITWAATPTKMGFPGDDAWPDAGPRLLGGTLETRTTTMNVAASGDERAVGKLYLSDGKNLTRGGVFSALQRSGFAITPLRCGRTYTQMAHNWYRIQSPSTKPAVLYRKVSCDSGVCWENYAVRLDNQMPPLRSGEREAAGRECPS